MSSRIAVAVDAEGRLSRHFGRSAGIDFFDIDEKDEFHKIEIHAANPPNPGGHACSDHGHGHSTQAEHGHAQWIETLKGCTALICGGMGRRAADDLKQAGIEPVLTDANVESLDAARMFVRGTLPRSSTFCRAHA